MGITYRPLRRYKYQLLEPYSHRTNIPNPGIESADGWVTLLCDTTLLVKKGYVWDGPSGPTIDTKNFMRGSLVHDALYQLMREGKLDPTLRRKQADLLLYNICVEAGMSRARAGYVYRSLRIFGGKHAQSRVERAEIEAP